jgi:hypothetical protein
MLQHLISTLVTFQMANESHFKFITERKLLNDLQVSHLLASALTKYLYSS